MHGSRKAQVHGEGLKIITLYFLNGPGCFKEIQSAKNGKEGVSAMKYESIYRI
jgi:hypothetical protein